MKKYFVKYLPVEGQIKEGYCITDKNEIIYYNGNYGDEFPSTLKPVKLYLCSRDIQAGNKVKINSNGEWLDVEVVNLPSYNRDTYGVKSKTIWGNYSEVVKVIGEISSAADWIKEGDEFDEIELEIILMFLN